jgi:hypothetical protein
MAEHPIFGIVRDELERAMRRLRKGFYAADVTHHRQSFRRVQVDPEWLDGGAVDYIRRISSPIIDVIPKLGTRMAVISQDGVPELGAVLGQIWDDLAELPTAWIRANLQKSPGRLEVGAEESIHIVVKDRDGDVKESFELDDIGGGVIHIEADGVRIGSSTVDLLGEVSSQLTELQTALDAVKTFGNAIQSNGAGPLSASTSTAGGTMATAVDGVATQLASIQSKINSITV